MLYYVLIVAVVNLLLGAALAAWREHDFAVAKPASLPSLPRFRRDSNGSPKTEPALATPVAEATEVETYPTEYDEFHPLDTSRDTHDERDDASLEEVFRPVFSLDIEAYRRNLIDFAERAVQGVDAATIAVLTAELEELHQQWKSQATLAQNALRHHHDLGDCESCAERLIELLTTIDGRATEPANTPDQSIATYSRRMQDHVSQVLFDLQLLRDDRLETRLNVLHRTGGMAAIKTQELADPQTGLHNRLGIEAVHRQWRKEQTDRDRPWAIAVLDLDGFTALNQQRGAAAGDRILRAFAELADELLRKDRSYDRAGRYYGDSFVYFLGDADADSAINAAERIRQSIEASSFVLDGLEIELTVSVGVALGSPADSLATALCAAEQAAYFAKLEGGNCTCFDTDAGPRPEPPRHYQVKGRVMTVPPLN